VTTGIWFVTPAWQRFKMTAVCLEQRRRVIAELEAHGIEAHQVVIADDENLDIARGLGAEVVERDNDMVGRKFNDGMEYAGQHGAEWVVPIGSDSWIASDYFLDLDPDPAVTRTSEAYCVVMPHRLAQLWVSPQKLDWSAGPYVFHRSLLEPAGFRPSAENSRMVDTSTIAGIVAATGRPIGWQTRTVHPFQYVGFRVEPLMTSYGSLRKRWGVSEVEPWGTLRRYYPADLVEQARRSMR
jgi:hypothetical protein